MRIPKPKRDDAAVVTCTTDEKEMWYNMASESGRTFSGYVRWLILREKERLEEKHNGEL
jgi:hypothetical protein